jgi:type IV secretion system protein VirB5
MAARIFQKEILMTRKLLLMCTVALVFTSHAAAQIPVTDGASIANNILNHAEAIAKSVETINQMKAQLDQAKQLYDQLNGLRNVGGLMNDQLLKQSLPPDYQQAYNLLKSGKSSSLSGISGSLNDITKMYQAQSCAQYGTSTVQAGCKSAWQDHSMNQYVGESGYQQASQNIQDLQNFVTAIRSSPDSKSLQDLQARISVEQVKIQNENLKLQTISMMQKAQENMRRQNSIDNTVKRLKPGMIHF